MIIIIMKAMTLASGLRRGRTWRRVLGFLVVMAVALVAAACAGPHSARASQTSGSPRLRIVAAFYPFQFVAERVAGAHAQVTSLVAPGAEPHDLELTPRQVASVVTADLVIYERSFQPAVDDAVVQAERDPQHVLDTTTVVPLVDHGQLPDPSPRSRGLDPHVWLDPTRLATIGQAVADRLAGVDPAHAADYRTAASQLQNQLRRLDGDFHTGLAACQRTAFITTHAAFGYLAERYGLIQIGVTGLSPDTEPSPARIAEVQREARTRGITTIFYETLISPAVAESLANDLRLRVDVLDPVEGITPASRGADYLSVMSANLTALREANGCR
jgi:zinc transport system substrate-binding protein